MTVVVPPKVRAVLRGIIARKGGEQALTEYELDIALEWAQLLCSEDPEQQWKAAALEKLLPPDVPQQGSAVRLRDDMTLREMALEYAQMLRDGSYDMSPEEGQEVACAIDGTDKTPIVEPVTIDLPRPPPVIGDEPAILRPAPKPPLHSAAELAQATPLNSLETKGFVQPRRVERMPSKRDSHEPVATQFVEARRQQPAAQSIPAQTLREPFTPLSEREPTQQQAKIDEQYARARSGMNNHSDTFRPPRRGMS